MRCWASHRRSTYIFSNISFDTNGVWLRRPRLCVAVASRRCVSVCVCVLKPFACVSLYRVCMCEYVCKDGDDALVSTILTANGFGTLRRYLQHHPTSADVLVGFVSPLVGVRLRCNGAATETFFRIHTKETCMCVYVCVCRVVCAFDCVRMCCRRSTAAIHSPVAAR